MDATLPFQILYACLSTYFLWDAKKHGLLPWQLPAVTLWSGLLFYLRFVIPWLFSRCVIERCGFWHIQLSFTDYTCVHKEGLGYGDVSFSPPPLVLHSTRTFLPRLWLLAASHSLAGRKMVLLVSRSWEKKKVIKNPLPFGQSFTAAAGFVHHWDHVVAGRPLIFALCCDAGNFGKPFYSGSQLNFEQSTWPSCNRQDHRSSHVTFNMWSLNAVSMRDSLTKSFRAFKF